MTLSSVLPDTEVTAYECELAERLGVEHVVAVSSGTAALQTALEAVNVRPGDEVLLPALSVVMSAAPIVHLGARPVFVDCNTRGTDFDYDDLTRKISERTAAVLPVHLWGRAGDTARLRRFADDRGLVVVADACQALGSTIDGVQVGIEATIGCFSTQELKLLSTSEGGFLTTRDDDLADRARAYRSHWLSPPSGQRPLSRLAHNSDQGVPNSTGSFHLIPLDQRSLFTGDAPPTCTTAAEFLDGILAVVLTRHDDDKQIRHYAETITREVTRWASA